MQGPFTKVPLRCLGGSVLGKDLQSVGIFSSFSNHPGQRFMKSRELDETYCIQKRQDIFLNMLS